jgi:hypothetical protein
VISNLVHDEVYSMQHYIIKFQQYVSYIVAFSFIGGGNRSTRRKPSTCRKSLTNFITLCCIEYTSPWARFEFKTLVVYTKEYIYIICVILHTYYFEFNRSVLLVEEVGVLWENHRPPQDTDKLHHILLCWVHLAMSGIWLHSVPM